MAGGARVVRLCCGNLSMVCVRERIGAVRMAWVVYKVIIRQLYLYHLSKSNFLIPSAPSTFSGCATRLGFSCP